MKATIKLDDDLYRQLKVAAVLRGSKVEELVAEGIRMLLSGPGHSQPSRPIKLPIVKSRKPGTLKLTSQMIAEYETSLDSGNEA